MKRAKQKKTKTVAGHWKISPEQDPANGTRLSVRARVELAGEIVSLGENLISKARFRPFVKSFDSFRAYEAWRKKQNNPWLV
jgi:carbon monoxide dehydrogenase subunit G